MAGASEGSIFNPAAMNRYLRNQRLLSVALLAVYAGACSVAWGAAAGKPSDKAAPQAQTPPKADAAASKSDAPPPGASSAKDSKPVPAKPNIDKVLDQFNAQRDQALAQRQALMEKLKTATESEREAIIQQMQQLNKQLVEAQRARGKQIRDEMRQLRPAAAPPGRH
jgi:hypothetical protein